MGYDPLGVYGDTRDHSAVTTSSSGYFSSKWGPSARFKHLIADCPYNTGDLTYYVQTFTTGSSEFYFSGELFTLNSVLATATVNWTVTGPFTLTPSSNTVKVTKTSSSGTGTLTATVSGKTYTKNLTSLAVAIDGSSGISGGGNYSYLLPASGATYYWDDGQYITVTSGRTSAAAFYTAPYNVSSHDYVGCTVTYNGVSNYFYKMIQIYP